jgi:hypothetical protein
MEIRSGLYLLNLENGVRNDIKATGTKIASSISA